MRVSKVSKLREWIALSYSNPVEAFDRLTTIIDVKSNKLFIAPPAYRPSSYEHVWDAVARRYSAEGLDYMGEAMEVERRVCNSIEALTDAPIDPIHSADFALARICYLSARVTKPSIVVETGVAYGVTSTFILSALQRNGSGFLHSIDLPPLGHNVERYVGALVPDELRDSWRLHRGVTRRVLPGLVAQLGEIDMFVHDSLHTYRNIRFELDTVTPHLTPGAVVLADDIDENPAFVEWARKKALAFSGVVQEDRKKSLLGVALLV